MMKTAVEMGGCDHSQASALAARWAGSGSQEGLTCDLDDNLGMLFSHKVAFKSCVLRSFVSFGL